MRLTNSLQEAFVNTLTPDIIKQLQQTNQKYLSDVKHILDYQLHYLTRGISGSHPDCFKKDVRSDRRPTDSNKEWHDALNMEFLEKFNIKARSESLFCSKLSAGYGDTLYIIFPIGNFYMLYSRAYPDLFLEEPKKVEDMPKKAQEILRTVYQTLRGIAGAA